jgi:hypothetical protein
MMGRHDFDKVTRVVSIEQYDGDWVPEDLAEAIEWLQEKLSLIPEEHRGQARLLIDSRISYDSSYATVEIEYSRPATTEEIAERQREAAARAERDIADARRRLLALQEAAAAQR